MSCDGALQELSSLPLSQPVAAIWQSARSRDICSAQYSHMRFWPRAPAFSLQMPQSQPAAGVKTAAFVPLYLLMLTRL